jgi:H+/gluconate symporter-like permease
VPHVQTIPCVVGVLVSIYPIFYFVVVVVVVVVASLIFEPQKPRNVSRQLLMGNPRMDLANASHFLTPPAVICQ